MSLLCGNYALTTSYLQTFTGSQEERLAVESAITHGTKPDTYQPDTPFKKDVDFKVDTEDLVYVGSDFEVKIPLTNRSAEERNVNLFVSVQICYYTGNKVKTKMQRIFQNYTHRSINA